MTLENFRSFKEAIPIEGLSSVNVFIGPNNVGKSNILEALRYIQALSRRQQLRIYPDLVFDRNPDINIHVTLRLSLSTEERKKTVTKFLKGNSHFTPEEVMKTSLLSTLVLDVSVGKQGIVQEEISVSNVLDGNLAIIRNSIEKGSYKSESFYLQTRCIELAKLENIPTLIIRDHGSRSPPPEEFLRLPDFEPVPVEYSILTMVREFISKWYWFSPQRLATARMPPGEETKLSSSGGNLVKLFNSIISEDPNRYVALINEILKILPNLSSVLSPLRGNEATVNVKEIGLETPTDLGNISFGVMQTLILATALMTLEPGSVILIEEPELHLHAGSQRRLFELMERETKQRQVFLTTHSSIFTGCGNQISTFLVTKRRGATNVHKVKERSELKLVKNELGHRNTDLYGYECAVFIEGDSEEAAFPIIAEALGYDLIEKGIRLVNVHGKGKVSKIAEYLDYLKDSDVLTYVIADGDKRVKERLGEWVRQGLLREDCHTIWNLEFEDCFEPHIVINAMKETAKEQGFEFQVTLADLEENRPRGKSIVKALEKLLYQKELPSLDKPALSENLALFLKEEIEKNPSENREKTLPEQVIEKIVRIVEGRRVQE